MSGINLEFVNRIVLYAESREMSWPSIEFGPIILASLAGATLGEVVSGIRPLPESVRWAALSCAPEEIASWQIIMSEVASLTWVQLSSSAALALGNLDWGRYTVDSLVPVQIARDRQTFDRIPPIANLYARRALITLPEPQGGVQVYWLCGVERVLSQREEAQIYNALSYAESVVSDRIRHGLGGYRPVATILASIDDNFQRALLAARSAGGLAGFLRQLDSDQATLSPAHEVSGVEVAETGFQGLEGTPQEVQQATGQTVQHVESIAVSTRPMGEIQLSELDGLQLKAMREAILSAFERDEFSRLLRDRLNMKFSTYVSETSYEHQVFELLEKFRGRGWLDQLMDAIEAERTASPQINRLRVTLGLLRPDRSAALDSVAVGSGALERMIRGSMPTVDLSRWLSELVALQGRVCRIEGSSFGTGVLVAPDLVLTNHHVVAAEVGDAALPSGLICRFDYSSNRGGDGRTVRLAENWLVAHRLHAPSDESSSSIEPNSVELDYAVIRLAEAVGEDTIATGKRGTVPISRSTVRLAPGEIVQIVQHPKAAPLAMSIGTIKEYAASGRRIRYLANTECGSSGSPVLLPNLTIVALHHAGDPDWRRTAEYNQGIPIDLIVQDLEKNPHVPRFWSDP